MLKRPSKKRIVTIFGVVTIAAISLILALRLCGGNPALDTAQNHSQTTATAEEVYFLDEAVDFFGLNLIFGLDWSMPIQPKEGYEYAELHYSQGGCEPGQRGNCPYVMILDNRQSKWEALGDLYFDEDGHLVEPKTCASGNAMYQGHVFQNEISIGDETALYYESDGCPGYPDTYARSSWHFPKMDMVIMSHASFEGVQPDLSEIFSSASWNR